MNLERALDIADKKFTTVSFQNGNTAVGPPEDVAKSTDYILSSSLDHVLAVEPKRRYEDRAIVKFEIKKSTMDISPLRLIKNIFNLKLESIDDTSVDINIKSFSREEIVIKYDSPRSWLAYNIGSELHIAINNIEVTEEGSVIESWCQPEDVPFAYNDPIRRKKNIGKIWISCLFRAQVISCPICNGSKVIGKLSANSNISIECHECHLGGFCTYENISFGDRSAIQENVDSTLLDENKDDY